MKLTLNELRALLKEAIEPKFFHGSSHPHKIGTTLSGGHFKSDFPRQFEQLVDARRPKNMAGRLNGVFMVTNPYDVNAAGGSDSYVYELLPIGSVFRHNQDHLAEASSTFLRFVDSGGRSYKSQKISRRSLEQVQDVLNRSIDAYWSGTPYKGGSSVYEWIAPKAKIVAFHKRASMMKESFDQEKALASVRAMPDLSTSDFIKNPIPNFQGRLNSELTALGIKRSTFERALGRKKLPIQTVDLSALSTLQGWVTRQGVEKAIKGERDWDPAGLPTVVLTTSGELVVSDGNHRLAALVWGGEKEAQVRVLDLMSLQVKTESLNEQDLDERALTSSDAGDELALCVEQQHNRLNLVLYRRGPMRADFDKGMSPKTLKKHVVAMLSAGQGDFNVPFFEVQLSVADKGWGPFMYDTAMAKTGGLMSDRMSVSAAARRVWDYYYHERNDVKVTPLDKYGDKVKLTGDDVLDNGFQLKGAGPNTSELEERHDPDLTYNVVEAARQLARERI